MASSFLCNNAFYEDFYEPSIQENWLDIKGIFKKVYTVHRGLGKICAIPLCLSFFWKVAKSKKEFFYCTQTLFSWKILCSPWQMIANSSRWCHLSTSKYDSWHMVKGIQSGARPIRLTSIHEIFSHSIHYYIIKN